MNLGFGDAALGLGTWCQGLESLGNPGDFLQLPLSRPAPCNLSEDARCQKVSCFPLLSNWRRPPLIPRGLARRFAPAEDLGPGRGAEALKIAGFFFNGHRLMWFKGVSRGNRSAG